MRVVLLTLLSLFLSVVSAGLIIPQAEEQHIGTPVPQLSDSLAAVSEPRIVRPPLRNAVQPEAPEALERRKHHTKTKVTGGKVTYYYGPQLLNPACGGSSPNDGSMTAAISFDSPFQCGDKIRLSRPNGKSAVVTVVDRCAGCSYNWIDVTKGVFQIFSDLDTGVLHDVTMTKQ